VAKSDLSRDLLAAVEAAIRRTPEAATAVPPESAEAASPNQPLILLADENADLCDDARRLLGQRFRVVCVANGSEALAGVRELRPDLVLAEVTMPGLDGFQLLRAIREDSATKTLPVILLLARSDEESMVEGLEAGADDYLGKPFTARELLARVTVHLQMAKLRQEVEDAPAKSARLFRLAADTAPVMIWLSDADGNFQYFNRAWFELTGRAPEQELGQGWFQGVHPIDRQRCLDAYRSAFQLRQPFRMEYQLRHADGGYRWLFEHGIPRYSDGGFAGYVGSCVDITERKTTEEAQFRLAAIVESSDDAIISKDLDGTITSWNRGAQRIFEYTAEEAVGKPITLIIPRELHDEEGEILRRLRRGERIEHFETVRVTKTGKKVDISLTVSPVKDASGRIVGASKIARDISERKQAEMMLQQVHDELERRVEERTAELEKAQEDLRALTTRLLQMQDEERRRIARELHDSAGQILAALSMNLVPLEAKLKTTQGDLAKPVTASIQLVDELSQDLRTISHLLHPPLLDEAGLASALQWFVEGFAERSRIPVDLKLAPDLGRLAPDLETTIFRVVQECLTNIHRHSGSPTAGITIRREGGNIRVEIRDWGKGMSLPFRTASSGSIRTGVGIQGMKERVRQLRGGFEMQSGSSGTLVTVRLPEESASAQKAS
jgi:PAS domain S-box-containing protein